MIQSMGLLGKQGESTFISTSMDITVIKSILASAKLESIKKIGVSDYNLLKYKKLDRKEIPEFIIVVDETFLTYERLEVKSKYKAYESVSNDFVVAEIKNKSGELLKGHQSLLSILDEDNKEELYDIDNVFPVRIIIKNSNDVNFNRMFCSVNGLPLNSNNEEMAYKICTEGSLSIVGDNFSFINFGRVIAKRTSSITLMSNIVSCFKLGVIEKFEVNERYETVNNIWDIIVTNLDVFTKVIADPSKIKSYRIETSPYYLIFKPALNLALFEAFYLAEKQGMRDELINYLNNEDFSLTKKWRGIITDEKDNVMSKNKHLMLQHIIEKVNIN